MILRTLEHKIIQALNSMPVVAILGYRQVGKTTLAFEISKNRLDKPVSYLDLELDSDLAKLSDPEAFLKRFEGKLLIIDEVQGWGSCRFPQSTLFCSLITDHSTPLILVLQMALQLLKPIKSGSLLFDYNHGEQVA